VSDTPRTDRARLDEHDPAVAVASECSKLECELNAANRRIKRLEEAGDAVEERLGCGCGCGGPCRACRSASENWFKAKEAKP
jgi:hypothetical protein